jgi:hypothetical protein
MQSFCSRATCRHGENDAASRALRFDPVRENRLAVSLVVLVSFATVSVVAATSALSRHTADRIAAEFRR